MKETNKMGGGDVCPVERAGSLESDIRKFLQNPRKILAPYIKKGMTVLDLGCGPGLFSVEMAGMVGESGRVIAVDLQEGMLQKVKARIEGTEIEKRIRLHKCSEKSIDFSEEVDFILAFYVVHEVPDAGALFCEMESILKPGGRVLVVEPRFFHGNRKAFEETVRMAERAGFIMTGSPKVCLSRSALFIKR